MNKLKLGITIFGWLFILSSIISSVFIIAGYFAYNEMEVTQKVSFNMFIGLMFIQSLYVALLLILGIAVLKLKPWAPLMAIIIAALFLVLDVPVVLINIYLKSPLKNVFRGIFPILVSIATIYFFTRPKVKAQFK